MDHEFRFTAEKIGSRIRLARTRRFMDQRELEPFRLQELVGSEYLGPGSDCSGDLPELVPGSYWGGIDFRFRLTGRFEIPTGWRNPGLWLPLGEIGDIFNHPEALVLVDGRPAGSADRHHHTISLGAFGCGPHRLVLEGWTGWSSYPPEFDSKEKLRMNRCFAVEANPVLEEFLARAECALESALLLEPGCSQRNAILDSLDAAFLALDTRHPLGLAMHESASTALQELVGRLEEAGSPIEAELLGIGHAHMDVGYLWTVSETRRKTIRTFSNVLRLMDRYSDFCFSHSQPAVYAMAEADNPEIFSALRERVQEGRWEAVGGMWVEADTNMPCAESLVRQILIGRRWFADRFGDSETPVLWLPDTFGFSWCLPQLMRLSGLQMLVTNKPNWNQHNRLPASTFIWQGMDGSRVPVHVLTSPREVRHLPFPTNYKSDLSGVEVKGTLTNAIGTELSPLPICFGFGNGGGGPTEELILRARAYAATPAMPKLRMGRASELVDASAGMTDRLPVIDDEIYVEGHRGVLTGQAWIKRANRQSEAALHRVELLCVLAGVNLMPTCLTRAWEKLCLNQFHDILTGTCIPDVLIDARRDFAEILETCSRMEAGILKRLAPGEPGVLNPSPLRRHDLALIAGPAPPGMASQKADGGTLVGLPPLQGYDCARLLPGDVPFPLTVEQRDGQVVLENSRLTAEIGDDGCLTRLFDRTAGRELLAMGQRGNRIWAFEDRPIGWDAWDIDPFFEDRAEEVAGVESIEITETGPLRVEVTVSRRYRSSRIVQRIQLTDRSPRLDLKTWIDWRQSHVLLKAAFPVSVSSPFATCGIQWGHIDRPTTRNNRIDASRFEVCAQRWMAIHDGSYAVALLDDCKFGHDAVENVLRLTLLKSSTWPDPLADRCEHEFTYSIMGQEGAGFSGIRAEAEALNHPLLVAPGLGELSPPVSIDRNNVLIETVKPSEDGNGYILRIYESEGHACSAELAFGHGVAAVAITDLHEANPESLAVKDRRLTLTLAARQILTLRVVPDTSGMAVLRHRAGIDELESGGMNHGQPVRSS